MRHAAAANAPNWPGQPFEPCVCLPPPQLPAILELRRATLNVPAMALAALLHPKYMGIYARIPPMEYNDAIALCRDLAEPGKGHFASMALQQIARCGAWSRVVAGPAAFSLPASRRRATPLRALVELHSSRPPSLHLYLSLLAPLPSTP